MSKPFFDQDALISMFENATAKQAGQLRQAAGAATLQALQGRELSLKNIRSALKAVSGAASLGAANNTVAGMKPEALLEKAVAGIDDALLKAVDAQRAALSQLSSQGVDLREKTLKRALDELGNFEDTIFSALKKTASMAGAPMAGPWEQVLQKMQAGGTMAGAKASTTVEQLMSQMQTSVRDSRAAGMRAAQVMAESYAAMASGVLIGMSEAMRGAALAGAPAPASAPAPAAASAPAVKTTAKPSPIRRK